MAEKPMCGRVGDAADDVKATTGAGLETMGDFLDRGVVVTRTTGNDEVHIGTSGGDLGETSHQGRKVLASLAGTHGQNERHPTSKRFGNRRTFIVRVRGRGDVTEMNDRHVASGKELAEAIGGGARRGVHEGAVVDRST